MHPTYPFAIAGTQTSMCPTRTATIANPGLNPFVIEDEATWYIEILNASAIQKPKSDGQVHFLSCDSKGTGSRSLFDLSPLLPVAKEPDTGSSLKRCTKLRAMLVRLEN